jgi:hypothetical protein
VLVVLAGVVVFLLWRVAVIGGYLSDRHTVLVVLCSVYWAVAGTLVAGRLLAERALALGAAPGSRWADGGRWSLGLLLGLTAAMLPRTLEPLHHYRGGFRAAGEWLAAHTRSVDPVMDPYCWAHYYAGRVFTEGIDMEVPLHPHPNPTMYVVLEAGDNPHLRLWSVGAAKAWARRGKLFYRWTGHRGKHEAEILVYKIGNK